MINQELVKKVNELIFNSYRNMYNKLAEVARKKAEADSLAALRLAIQHPRPDLHPRLTYCAVLQFTNYKQVH